MRRIRVIGPGKKGDGCGNLEQKNHGPAFLPFIRTPRMGGAAWWAPWPPAPSSPTQLPSNPYPRPAAGLQPLRTPRTHPAAPGRAPS